MLGGVSQTVFKARSCGAVRLPARKGTPAVPFHVTTRRPVFQPAPANWVSKVCPLFQTVVAVGVPSAAKVIRLAVSTPLQPLESYCEAYDAAPVEATWTVDSENEVVNALIALAMLAKARVRPSTMLSGRPAVK